MVIKCIAILIFLIVVYYFIGRIALSTLAEECHITMVPMIGYIICMVVFQMLAIPAMLLKLSLSVLEYIYSIVMGGIIAFGISKKVFSKHYFSINKREIAFLLVIISVQCIFLWLNMRYGSVWDNGEYVGSITTAIYTDTMKQYNAYSGNIFETFDWRECFITFEMHSAVICKMLSIHPLLYIHRILAPLEIILYNIILYNTVVLLINNRVGGYIALCGSFFVNISLGSICTWAAFLFLRTGESKSMLANLIFPLLVYLFIYYLKFGNTKFVVSLMFSGVLVGLGIGRSGTYLIPVLLSSMFIPTICSERKIKTFFVYLLCMLPVLLYLCVDVIYDKV